jgi:hypothetical protein
MIGRLQPPQRLFERAGQLPGRRVGPAGPASLRADAGRRESAQSLIGPALARSADRPLAGDDRVALVTVAVEMSETS